MVLTSQEKKHLLLLARFVIESGFKTEIEEPQSDEVLDILQSKSGAFVTLTINKKLRGCIGFVQADQELIKTIMEAAYQAAFHDPRFPRLSEEEYPNISIEISVLSEPFPLESYDEIVIGKHGLILEDLGRKALLLPQVPIEHKFDRNAYLSALCNKAGLPKDSWKESQLKLKGFTATVFSEKDEDLK